MADEAQQAKCNGVAVPSESEYVRSTTRSYRVELVFTMLQLLPVAAFLGLVEFGTTSSLYEWVHESITQKWYALTLLILAYLAVYISLYVQRKTPVLNWVLLLVLTPMQALFYASIDVALKSNTLFLAQIYIAWFVGCMVIYDLIEDRVINLPKGAVMIFDEENVVYASEEQNESPAPTSAEGAVSMALPVDSVPPTETMTHVDSADTAVDGKLATSPRTLSINEQHSNAKDTVMFCFVSMSMAGVIFVFSTLVVVHVGVVFGRWYVWLFGFVYVYCKMNYFMLAYNATYERRVERQMNKVPNGHVAIYVSIGSGLFADYFLRRMQGMDPDIEDFM